MKKGEFKYRVIRGLMPILFMWYLVSVSFFAHSHIVNGEIINHSHPFSKEHQHSQNQIDTISLLEFFSVLEDILPHLNFDPMIYLVEAFATASVVLYYNSISKGSKRFRAPPMSVFTRF